MTVFRVIFVKQFLEVLQKTSALNSYLALPPQMYGRYSTDLAEYALKEGKKIRAGKETEKDDLEQELLPYRRRFLRIIISRIR